MTQRRDLQVYGYGNALVDVLVDVSAKEFTSLNLEKGRMMLVEVDQQQRLLSSLGDRPQKLMNGGSVGNSIIAIAQLGGKAGMVCRVGADRFGEHYRKEMLLRGVAVSGSMQSGAPTGTCLSLITPDSERTMCTHLGVTSTLSDADVDAGEIRRAEWIFIEGYTLLNGAGGLAGAEKAARLARESGARVALTLSDNFVVELCREKIQALLPIVDLLFANATEAQTLTGMTTDHRCFDALKAIVPGVAMTASERGAFVHFAGQSLHAAAHPCHPVDMTGAGDMFAGAFLFGVTNGASVADSAERACYLASRVISQVGPRLPGDLSPSWNLAAPRSPVTALN